MFGEDPFIVGVNVLPVRFSAWDYARRRSDVLYSSRTSLSARTDADGEQ